MTNTITSLILVAIWVMGLVLTSHFRPDIPRSMLIIGTIFFVALIPAMKELVRMIERMTGRSGPVTGQPGREHRGND